MALAGHSGSHSVQSMHSSGSITRKFGPSWKQSTGHTSTQSVYLHLMQFSVTTKVMATACCGGTGDSLPARSGGVLDPHQPAGSTCRGEGMNGAPYEVRTRVSALRGRRPGPLDEGSALEKALRRRLV